jgi:hypothetical protein
MDGFRVSIIRYPGARSDKYDNVMTDGVLIFTSGRESET